MKIFLFALNVLGGIMKINQGEYIVLIVIVIVVVNLLAQ